MTLHSMIVLAPIVFAIHNAEEAPGMAAWAATLPTSIHPGVTHPQFVIALLALTLVLAAVAAWAFVAPNSAPAIWTLMAFQAAVGLNALVPHLVMLLRQRRYNPGVVTAALLLLPFSVWFFREAVSEQIVGPSGFVVLALSAPVMMVSMTLGSLRLGGFLASGTRAPNPANPDREAYR